MISPARCSATPPPDRPSGARARARGPRPDATTSSSWSIARFFRSVSACSAATAAAGRRRPRAPSAAPASAAGWRGRRAGSSGACAVRLCRARATRAAAAERRDARAPPFWHSTVVQLSSGSATSSPSPGTGASTARRRRELEARLDAAAVAVARAREVERPATDDERAKSGRHWSTQMSAHRVAQKLQYGATRLRAVGALEAVEAHALAAVAHPVVRAVARAQVGAAVVARRAERAEARAARAHPLPRAIGAARFLGHAGRLQSAPRAAVLAHALDLLRESLAAAVGRDHPLGAVDARPADPAHTFSSRVAVQVAAAVVRARRQPAQHVAPCAARAPAGDALPDARARNGHASCAHDGLRRS